MLISSARSAMYLEYLVYFISSTQLSAISIQPQFAISPENQTRRESTRNTRIRLEFVFIRAIRGCAFNSCVHLLKSAAKSSSLASELVVRPSIPHRWRIVLAALKGTLLALRLFLCAEYAFF